jgi:hypothetical protein
MMSKEEINEELGAIGRELADVCKEIMETEGVAGIRAVLTATGIANDSVNGQANVTLNPMPITKEDWED